MKIVAVIGAGNGGKAAAADMALQGLTVRLYEFPEFGSNLDAIRETKTLVCKGEVLVGNAKLDFVSTDMGEVVKDADFVMVCTQAGSQERTAKLMAPFVTETLKHIMLNPGCTGGSLIFHKVFREHGVKHIPVLSELETLTYGCRSKNEVVDVTVKVTKNLYATIPAKAIEVVGPEIEKYYPGLVRGMSVLEAGLSNANPVIHPPITLMNAARMEKEGSKMYFYKDGVSKTVAEMIKKLDEERMSLLRALGYPAQSDAKSSVEQGYALSEDYYECYAHGPAYMAFTCPDTLNNRYFHEDIGMGLVLYHSLGQLLGVPTPVTYATILFGSAVIGIDYVAKAARTTELLGINSLTRDELVQFCQTGAYPKK